MSGGGLPPVSTTLLVYAAAAPAGLALVHVAVARARRNAPGSPQARLAKLAALLALPAAAGAAAVAAVEGRPAPEAARMTVFALLVYAGLAYAYFHVFNMSETARRIRILLEIGRRGALPVEDLAKAYTPSDMIDARLDRLVRMNQLARGEDGRYRVKGRLLLWAGGILRTWRRMLFGRWPKARERR
jgi:hypothetical protein